MATRLLSGAFSGDDDYRPPSRLSEIFREQPVDLHTFIQDRKFLGLTDIRLSDVQANAVSHIERIFYPDLYPLMAEEFDDQKSRDYWAQPIPVKNIISLEWGKGSGKDAISRFSSLRVAYLLLCMHSPQKYFGMPDFDSIHLLNIAANSAQAMNAFFTPMREAVKRGWFVDKADPKQNIIEYDNHIIAISGHSDAESQEGLNIMLGVADEIDAFRARDEMVGLGKRSREASTSAESILKMLKGSAATRFPQTYKRVTISYPRYLGSTIQKQTAEGLASIQKYGEKSIHYVSGPLATWEVNPRVHGPEDFQEDYDNDPEEAASMYECRPTRATDAYFRNPVIFDQAVDRATQPISVDYEIREFKSPETGNTTRGWEPVFTFSPDFRPVSGARYAMHGDLAIKGDRAGIAMSHIESWGERWDVVTDETGFESEIRTVEPVLRNDFTISFSADSSAKDDYGNKLPREIQIRWAHELAFQLIKRGFWIGAFTFDGFQSAGTIQTLLMHGIESKRVSTDLDPNIWKTIKDVASSARLRMPFNQRLRNELESLSRVDGGKVDHPPGGCFVGETRIPLLDGTSPRISRLVGQQVWVYSCTTDGSVVSGLARGRMTKTTSELVDVALDGGYEARCTPEHLWMLQDGSYREASELRPGVDLLMAFEQDSGVADGGRKVLAVTSVIVDDPVPVYDLEVDDFHNFALEGGAFVHNSKDEADAFACSIVVAISLGGEEDPGHEIAEVGVGFFELGEPLVSLVGMEEMNFGSGNLGLPIGMKGMSFSGD